MSNIDNSPWGKPDSVTELADGIFEVCTPLNQIDIIKIIQLCFNQYGISRLVHLNKWDFANL